MLFKKAEAYAKSTGIDSMLSSADAVIVGFSGGADSSVLLSFFLERRKKFPNLRIVAAHVNHMIRGAEADGDEEFCRQFCRENDVDLEVLRADIPALSEKRKMGLEETARAERYAFFESLSKKYNNSLIATAHNADDNLETLVINLVRGSGTKGLSGISPVRDGKFIRPLLSCSSEEIRAFAKNEGISFVTDSTNADTEYTRNAFRCDVVPLLRLHNPKVTDAALRLSKAAREDCDYIEGEARKLISQGITRELLRSIHPALFQRVVLLLYREKAGTSSDLSEKNVSDCRKLILGTEAGYISLPHSLAFFADKNLVFVALEPQDDGNTVCNDRIELCAEKDTVFGSFCIRISENEGYINTINENVYNLSLHTTIDCGKINGKLYARVRQNGDTVYLRKMTRKLKKLYCDADVPTFLRNSLPVIEDSDGIVFVPFIGVRDGCSPTKETKKTIILHIYKRR